MHVTLGIMTLLTTISFLSRRSSAFLLARGARPCDRRHPGVIFESSMTVSTLSEDDQLVQDMHYRIRAINNMDDDVKSSLIDFKVDDVKLGKVQPNTAEMLCAINTGPSNSPVFELLEDQGSKPHMTISKQAGMDSDSRTRAVAGVMDQLRSKGVVKGWRDELYPVSDSFYNPAVFLMERAAVDLLGILQYGVHINGLVQESLADEPKMWIGRRAATKSKFPGMLDHLVAGGQPAGLGLLENVIKECEEEAGIPESIARAGVRAAGAISYEHANFEQVSRVVLFNYDLYLPQDFSPRPVDGEVEEFFLWSIDQVKESMATDYHDPFKPNCYVVIIDYLLRMGHVSPETPGYLDILRELRSGDCR